MEHAFTNEAGQSGIWTLGGRIYCRWRWARDTGELVVVSGDVIRCWAPPQREHGAEAGIELDLAETARDVAHLIHRETDRAN